MPEIPSSPADPPRHSLSHKAPSGVENEQDDQVPLILSAASTVASSHIEPDVFSDEDETYPESTNTSYLSSIASDIRRGVVENGRTYGVYGKHKAWLPSDDLEVWP